MEKYRVRLKNGRIVGPFTANQVIEMRDKGHIVGQEDCQVFPTGDWLSLERFEFWAKSQATRVPSDGTFVIDLSSLKNESSAPKELPSEVKGAEPLEMSQTTLNPPPQQTPSPEAAKPTGLDIPGQFREFDYRQAVNRAQEEGISLRSDDSLAKKIPLPPVESEVSQDEGEEQDEGRTIIRTSPAKPSAPADDGRTVVTPAGKEWKEQLEKEKARQEEQRRLREEDEKRREKEKAIQQIDYNAEATQAISLAEIKYLAVGDSARAEYELAQEENVIRRQEAEAVAKKRKEEDKVRQEKEAEEQQEENSARRKKLVLGSLLLLVVLLVLFPDDKPVKKAVKKIVPVDPTISFPVPYDVKDPVKSEQFLTVAKKRLETGTYIDRIAAATAYRAAYENDISRKDALSKMIRTYGELLTHSSDKQKDGNTLFKLLQANRVLQEVDPDVALGAGLFYRAIDKKDASLDVLDRFVKSQSNKPSRELFAAYLVGLSDKNLEAKADQVAESLLKTEKRGIVVNLSLIHYYRYKNYPEKAREVLADALKEFPNSVPLLIAESEFLLEESNLKSLVEITKKIQELSAEGSRLYYGRLLEFQGFIDAAGNKTEAAALKFAESLKYSDSDSLRDRLTNIQEVSGDPNNFANKLIRQVKARELTKKAQSSLDKFDIQGALLSAIEAYDLNSGYTRADLMLSEIQIRLGMTTDALNTLEDLQKKNATDKNVNFALLEAYIRNYKMTDAKRMFTLMANSEMRADWRYSSLNSEMYDRLGDINQSILWLQRAINQNPLEDDNLYKLSKLFLRAKRFPQAKNNLFKAMELNPTNIAYKLSYAEIIYETDGPDKAIDFLFGLLKQYPDNPSILGDIAIYYHRSGKNKQFLDVKKQIENLPVRDPRIYKFLAKASVLDEKFDDAIKYTEEYLKLEPGDLNAMMEMGQTLMKLKRYKESVAWFVRVRSKLSTYPRVGFYKAKIEMYVNNPDQAISDVREDMKVNGEYEEGLNLLGEILYGKDELIAAENEYKKALRLNARSYGALRGLADISFKRGQFDMALDLYKRAISELKSSGNDPTVHRKLGDVYRLMGQGSLAIESYRVYLKLVPDAADKAEIERHISVLE